MLCSDAGDYQVMISNSAGAALSSSASLSVLKAVPVITWASPAPITNGTLLGARQLTATANVPGNFVYSPAAGVLLGVGTNQLSVTFTPSDSANYLSSSASVNLAVLPNLVYDGVNLGDPTQVAADLDRDGVSNLMEYALGTDPRASTDARAALSYAELNLSGSRYLSLQFKRRKSTPGIQLQYLPEVSSDRKTWFSDGTHVFSVSVTSIDSQFDSVTVRDQTPTTISSPRFIRLRVTMATN